MATPSCASANLSRSTLVGPERPVFTPLVGSMRFRRSIRVGKGVRLNVTKTGVGVSVGTKGVRKSWHSSGRTTTSVGVPGTGVYWRDDKVTPKKGSKVATGPGEPSRRFRRSAAKAAKKRAAAENKLAKRLTKKAKRHPELLAPTAVAAAGWNRDPHNHALLRYWDGSRWTEHVSNGTDRAWIDRI